VVTINTVRDELTKNGQSAGELYLEAVEILLRKGVFSRKGYALAPDVLQALLELLKRRRLLLRAHESLRVRVIKGGAWCCMVVQCGVVWCSVVQCGAVCCSVLQLCCSVLQYVAVCCG